MNSLRIILLSHSHGLSSSVPPRYGLRAQSDLGLWPAQVACASSGVSQTCHKVPLHLLSSRLSQCKAVCWLSEAESCSGGGKFMLAEADQLSGLKRVRGGGRQIRGRKRVFWVEGGWSRRRISPRKGMGPAMVPWHHGS